MLAPVANLAVIVMSAFLTSGGGQDRTASLPGAHDEAVSRLAEEVRARGWIVFCARSEQGDWDVFACRPDGGAVRNMTHTPEFNEAAPQMSRDGRRLLYRRLPRGEAPSGNQYGTQGKLVLANADGTSPMVFGESGAYPWASWSPDGQQVACLSITGISFVDVASRRVVRTLPRKGFFQQMTWSPDGKSLAGVANAFGTSWSVGRIDVDTGKATAVSRVDCCTPDWFPDSQHLIFSNRPPGQRENHGNGWTQLWMADLEGKSRRLVYGEDGRHVYGGCISPDGTFVLFTGNMQEDGDPSHAGAPMGLLRLADAPLIGAESKELRKLHPQAKSGPVLVLPAGWEPCWTSAEIATFQAAGAKGRAGDADARATPEPKPVRAADDISVLAGEVRDKGWIAASAPNGQGMWDLFLMRPDGSQRRNLTQSGQYHKAGVRFAPDGKKLLYYKIPRSEAVDNNTYGNYELVVADIDGNHAVSYGTGFAWACWGPDGTHLACLDKSGILIVEVDSRRVLRKLPRKGIVRQLAWSPDGRSFAGTANGLGPYWNIGRLDADTARINAVSQTDRYNCTPDWMPDSRRILYSRGITPEAGGWAELWMGSGDGKERGMLYAEDKRHIYGGCASPDGKYLLFTRSEVDLGRVDSSRTSLAIIRMSDTPMVAGDGGKAREKYSAARRGPILDLSWGWEPHWTYAEIRLPKP
jgi:Tol biopolymer transport system component